MWVLSITLYSMSSIFDTVTIYFSYLGQLFLITWFTDLIFEKMGPVGRNKNKNKISLQTLF